MSFDKYYRIVSDINEKFRYLKSTEALFELDQWTGLPERGVPYRSRIQAYTAEQKAALFMTPEAARAADYFYEKGCGEGGAGIKAPGDFALTGNIPEETASYIISGKIRSFLTNYENFTKAPRDLIREYKLLGADTMNAWKKAREERDFRVFEPWLEKVFELKKRIALEIDPHRPAFDTLVDMTDKGLSVEEIASQFGVLKAGIMDLLAKTGGKDSVTVDISSLEEEPSRMEAFGRRLVEDLGFDSSKGAINHKVIHGFTSFLGPLDSRISMQKSGKFHLLFTCLHEAGHQMYCVGGNEEVNANDMWGGIEGSFHEAIARFYENIIGKSRAYWEHYYPDLQREFASLSDISLEAFLSGINLVRPSLRRIEADEVSYSLHPIIRFELERDYFEGRLKVRDMSEAWNEKYREYLGICPANDLEGVLQDMHWAGDYIGYFQSYALGNIYDGQILEAVLRDIPDLYGDVAKGRFDRLNAWMKENIWQYGGCFTSAQMLERLTGKGLDASAFVKYLNSKF